MATHSPSNVIPGQTETILTQKYKAIREMVQNSDPVQHIFVTSFVRYNDILNLWKGDSLNDMLPQLDERQQRTVRKDMLRLLTFLVYIVGSEAWFNDFQKHVFQDDGNITYVAKYDDKAMRNDPWNETKLAAKLGLASQEADRWHLQYIFTPCDIQFDDSDSVQQIGPQERLPLISCSPKIVTGAYGEVKFYEIPMEHLIHGGKKHGENMVVAVKTFLVKTDGPSEAHNMVQLKESLATRNSDGKVPHICIHHAIIRREENPESIEPSVEFSIIFPKAPWGDLSEFLNNRPRHAQDSDSYHTAERYAKMGPEGTDCRASQLLEQSLGIAEALEFLHTGFETKQGRQCCAHMDLKANNIVIFDEGPVGKWKICDFGISVVRGQDKMKRTARASILGSIRDYADEYTMATKPRRNEGSYMPPENAKGEMNAEEIAGRRGDIWSFGAVFADIFAFCVGGAPGFKDFCGQRQEPGGLAGVGNDRLYEKTKLQSNALLVVTAGEMTPMKFRVKPKVFEWLESNTDQAGHRVPWRQQWVDCIKDILKIKTDDRPPAKKLVEIVGKVLAAARVELEDTSTGPGHVNTSPPSSTFTRRPELDSSTPPIHIDAGGSSVLPGFAGSTPNDPANATSNVSSSVATLACTNLPNLVIFNTKSTGPITCICVDDNHAVYLSANHLRIFATSTMDTSSSVPKPQELDLPDDVSWTDLAVSEAYIVVCGRVSSGKAKIAFSRPKNGTWDTLSFLNVSWTLDQMFDGSKRTTVSQNGVFAHIRGSEVHTIALGQSKPQAFLLKFPDLKQMQHNLTISEVVDVAFENNGGYLYVCAGVSPHSIALLVYKFDMSSELPLEPPQPLHCQVFELPVYDRGDRDKTRLYPFSTELGCVVAVSGKSLLSVSFSGGPRPSRCDLPTDLNRHALKGGQACVLGDKFFIAVEYKPRPRHTRLKRFGIHRTLDAGLAALQDCKEYNSKKHVNAGGSSALRAITSHGSSHGLVFFFLPDGIVWRLCSTCHFEH